MYQLGIYKGKDLKEKPLEYLVTHFGKMGGHYYDIVRGIHRSEVKPHRIAKSVGVEHTYVDDIDTEQDIDKQLMRLAQELYRRIEKKKVKGKSLTLKIKYKDFSLFTRSKTQNLYFETEEEMYQTARFCGVFVLMIKPFVF